MESKLVVLFNQVLTQVLLNINGLDMFGALFHGAFEGEPLVEDGLFHTLLETLFVENVPAAKDTYVFVVDLYHTDGAFC
jgi:hypothetical protein